MFPVVTFRLTARSRRPSPSLVIAALRPREVWPVVTVHEGLSPASRRLRYSAPTPRLSPRMLRTLTNLRPGHHEAYAGWSLSVSPDGNAMLYTTTVNMRGDMWMIENFQ